jgi:glycosyltransferase involved in cell wall biosynthesis
MRYPDLAPRVRFIPAGIDLDGFCLRDREESRERLGITSGDGLVTFVGRLEPEKRPLEILEMFECLRARHPAARLLIVGDGRLRTELRRRTARLGTSAQIRNSVTQAELAQIFSASDLLVVASSHEGLPTVALEALACGTPVVGTEVGILPDIIRPGVNGFLVPSLSELCAFTEKALYQMTWVRSDCRASVRMFGWDQVAPAVLEVYREVAT